MNMYNPFMRDSVNANKKQRFNFRSNLSAMPRMPSPVSPSPKFSGRRGKVQETPVVANSRLGGSLRYSEGPATYKGSYASAIEPMDIEDWGEEGDYWNENFACEMDSSSIHPKSYVRPPPRGGPPSKLIKMNAVPNVQSNPYSGKNFWEKPKRQSVLKVDDSSGLSFKLKPKPQRKISLHTQVNEKKLFPKWSYSDLECKGNFDDKEACFPRIFTVTIEKLQKWPAKLTGNKAIFELFGILESISAGRYPRSKRITLKSEMMRDRLTCTFYEIDRSLPALEKGHWQRCIVLLRNNREYQCLQIRSASPNELKNLDKRVTTSSKAKALFIKTTP